ncbi:MAG: glycosyltransferase [Saprospirales bacterium]|nr:glycosyltransferase [Saprospirales bacterium]
MQKISIITPSFNQGQFLEQTIDSVLSQNYPNLDYIIIDGASTDNSVEIIKKYEKHLHFWTSEKDNGQSDAINKGLKYASGDIINWLNSDDYYEQDSLKKVAHYFEDETTLVVAGKSNIWKNNKICKQSTGTDIYNSVEKTIGFARIDQPETFFSKKAIDKMGFLNANLHYVMDREWWTIYLLIFGLDSIKKRMIF